MPPVARWFRVVAVIEAVSWTALLVAMFRKWVLDAPHEGGVPLVGPVHGAAFVLYVLTTVLTALRLRWSLRTTFLGLVASVPPFGSIVFERWAARTGHLSATADRTGGRTASSRP